MGFSRSIIIGSCSFILGMVFMCQVIDIPLLYIDLTDEAVVKAYKFYELWYEAPGAIKALFHAALGIPLIALCFKLNRWTESAMFFDGSSIALHMATVIIYLTVHISSLRTFLPDSNTTTSFSILPAPPPRAVPATEEEKIEAVRVLAAGNVLVGLLSLGVIGMQLGQEYARRQEEKEQREIDSRAAETKKDI